MGETEIPISMISGFSEVSQKPQNQFFLFLETPGYQTKQEQTLEPFNNILCCESLHFGKAKMLSTSEKTGAEK